ncbi:MAG TPA: hypothetical protein VNU26_14190 [Mycobacteriales bacterium]|nr:hypothetical protein [Mycobacteriales bacterium]
MSRRLVLAAACAAVLAGGAAAPALATADPTVVCVVTQHDPKTGERDGVCVWVPVESPLAPKPSR